MEKSEKSRLKHKSKKIAPVKKGINRIETKGIPIQQNIPQQNYLNLNNQVLPPQNPEESSKYQIQPQANIFPQQLAQQAIIVNQGGVIPQNAAATTLCPHCHQILLTRKDQHCNCLSFIIYTFMIIIFPVFIFYIAFLDIEDCTCGCYYGCHENCVPYVKCCSCPDRRNFDGCLCCCDISNYCSHCGKLITKNDSCRRICPNCCLCCC